MILPSLTPAIAGQTHHHITNPRHCPVPAIQIPATLNIILLLADFSPFPTSAPQILTFQVSYTAALASDSLCTLIVCCSLSQLDPCIHSQSSLKPVLSIHLYVVVPTSSRTLTNDNGPFIIPELFQVHPLKSVSHKLTWLKTVLREEAVRRRRILPSWQPQYAHCELKANFVPTPQILSCTPTLSLGHSSCAHLRGEGGGKGYLEFFLHRFPHFLPLREVPDPLQVFYFLMHFFMNRALGNYRISEVLR